MFDEYLPFTGYITPILRRWKLRLGAVPLVKEMALVPGVITS